MIKIDQLTPIIEKYKRNKKLFEDKNSTERFQIHFTRLSLPEFNFEIDADRLQRITNSKPFTNQTYARLKRNLRRLDSTIKLWNEVAEKGQRLQVDQMFTFYMGLKEGNITNSEVGNALNSFETYVYHSLLEAERLNRLLVRLGKKNIHFLLRNKIEKFELEPEYQVHVPVPPEYNTPNKLDK